MPHAPQGRDQTGDLLRNVLLLRALENTLGDAAADVIRTLYAEIVAAVVEIDPTAPRALRYRRERLDRLVSRVEKLAGPAYDALYKELRQSLATVGSQQAGAAVARLRFALGDGKLVVPPRFGLNAAKAVIDSRPMDGMLLRDWVANQKRRTVVQTNRALQVGFARGETNAELVKRIRGRAVGRGTYVGGLLDTSTREAQAIVRTGVQHIAAQAAMATYEANGDITADYELVATLDGRTTPYCRSIDRKRFRYDDPKRLVPPFHIGCRTFMAPLVDWEGMGLQPPPPGQRASMDGPVSDALDYEGWLRGKPAAEQDRILGPGRGRLFRDGMTLEQMVRTDGTRIPLSDLGKQAA